jgi:hypothetical protein
VEVILHRECGNVAYGIVGQFGIGDGVVIWLIGLWANTPGDGDRVQGIMQHNDIGDGVIIWLME